MPRRCTALAAQRPTTTSPEAARAGLLPECGSLLGADLDRRDYARPAIRFILEKRGEGLRSARIDAKALSVCALLDVGHGHDRQHFSTSAPRRATAAAGLAASAMLAVQERQDQMRGVPALQSGRRAERARHGGWWNRPWGSPEPKSSLTPEEGRKGSGLGDASGSLLEGYSTGLQRGLNRDSSRAPARQQSVGYLDALLRCLLQQRLASRAGQAHAFVDQHLVH